MDSLSGVTAVCVDTLHHRMAIRESMRLAEQPFAQVVLVTDEEGLRHLPPQRPDKLRIDLVPTIKSVGEYSRYVLHSLPDHVNTPHALVFQWDGFVLDIQRWRPDFLHYDYIGAPWVGAHASGPRAVGNGGFSLRSLKLLRAVREIAPDSGDRPEDNVICFDLADRLEHEYGIRFAPVSVANHFSVEHMTPANFRGETAELPAQCTFGFHGFFNFHLAYGDDELLELIDTVLGPAERAIILKSWNAWGLVVNLASCGRLHAAHELASRVARACDLDVPDDFIQKLIADAATNSHPTG